MTKRPDKRKPYKRRDPRIPRSYIAVHIVEGEARETCCNFHFDTPHRSRGAAIEHARERGWKLDKVAVRSRPLSN